MIDDVHFFANLYYGFFNLSKYFIIYAALMLYLSVMITVILVNKI